MRGELSSGRFAKRHPYDWYVDDYWVAYQLTTALGRFAEEEAEGLAIWDPCCGFGNTVQGLQDEFPIFLSDIVENVNWAMFTTKPIFCSADFLECDAAPAPCTIVCNPPYSYKKGILEAFVRHALKLATGRVCMVVPNKWLSSQTRYWLFMQDHHLPDFVFDGTGRCGGCRLDAQRRWDHRRERAQPSADAWADVRARRNALLVACDWTQLPDVPDAIRIKYAPYRQALRNITKAASSPDDVSFPDIPV